MIRLSNYRNHGIFTLRCIRNNLVPVSVKLKSTHSKLSQGAKKIIQKAEKQLLQDRVRCINQTTEDSGNRINNNKTKLASLVTSAGDLEKCSKFIEEVRGLWFTKVKERQVRKFSNLLARNTNALQNNRSVRNNTIQANNATNNNNNSNRDNRDSIDNNKWVINLSGNNLTKAQVSVLAKGPNYSIAPNNIPNMDYITAVESMCSKLKEEDAMALRTDINALLRKAKIPEPNLAKEERRGLAQLKKHEDKVVLIVDKRVAMVVMDRQDYINKAEELLKQPAYRTIPKDPTNKIKAQLITKLRRIKRQ